MPLPPHPILLFLLLLVAGAAPVGAQTASLRGQVTDESGAAVPGAKVILTGPRTVKNASAAIDGSYSFAGLAPGEYTVQVVAPDLALAQPARVTLSTTLRTLNLQLKVAAVTQQLNVQDTGAPAVSAEAANNASALVLRGDDLQALSDDPEDLQSDLMALAGPSAGPAGGSIFIDGFSGGQLPAKESIREIRINQNPFSPEYDKLGYGRIEIFTKPGSDKLHGTGFYNFGDQFWNSRNPYAAEKAPFILKEYGGNVSGPVNSRASFFFDVQRHSVDNGAIINGATLDPGSLAIVDPYTDVFRVPQRRLMLSPRLDYQLNANNTLIVRYGFFRYDIRDAGIGGFNLTDRGYHVENTQQHVQVTETAVLGASVVNEMRFQFIHLDGSQIANSANPAIQVLGSFSGGGSPVGHSFNTENDYEFQNYTSVAKGLHAWRFGARLRGSTVRDTSPQDFNGTFTFGGGALAPELNAANQPVTGANGQPVLIPIQSIEQYRRTVLFERQGLPAARIRALGGGATQYSVNTGLPAISAGQADAGLFVGDDWRVRPNVTLSLGLRYEMQTNIHDWRDFAPRIGLAWAPAGPKSSHPKTVVRAGFGMFYDRFGLTNTIAAERYNGLVQQQYVVANPDFFPATPSLSTAGAAASTRTVEELSAGLRAPYIMQSAFGVERQLPFNTTIAITYANSHGLHGLRSQDINAPLPGSYDPRGMGSGVYPLGAAGPIVLFESSGLYNQNQLIANVNSKVNRNTSLFGSLVFNRALSNTDGINTFPANPYSSAGEYGPASTDIRRRFSFGGSVLTKWNFRLSPLVILDSGPPFDITAGQDLYGDTLFNARPGLAVDASRPGLIQTRYGLLDPNPTPDEKIVPRNYGRGPGSFSVNLRIGRTFAFGPSTEGVVPVATGPGTGGGRRDNGGAFGMGVPGASATATHHRFNLTVNMSIRNLLNHTNPGPIIGNITSPLFGQANQPAGNLGGGGFSEAANNRRLELQMRLNF